MDKFGLIARSTIGPARFELTPELIKLVRRLNLCWDGGSYAGAPAVDTKRPYGNGDYAADICEILGWTKEGDDGDEPCWSSKQRQQAAELHRRTQHALRIVMELTAIEPGTYECPQAYYPHEWKRL